MLQVDNGKIKVYPIEDQDGYRATGIDDSGRFILGHGHTYDDAYYSVAERLDARNDFLKLPACEQLRIIVDTNKDLSSIEMSDAIKLLSEIVLNL